MGLKREMRSIEVKGCTLISFQVLADDRRACLAAVTSLGWILLGMLT
jgi:hypothetical protein